MAIDSLIGKLKYVMTESPDKMLSLYVNTDMRNPDQQGRVENRLENRFSEIKRVSVCQ